VKLAYFILALAPLSRGDSLEAVLDRMDQAARTFHSLSADLRRTDYSSLFDEKKGEDGKLKIMKRAKTGVALLVEFTGQDPRKLRVSGNKAEIYYPKANSEDVYDTRKFTKSADLLMLVGFGTSRADLEKRFTISLGGSETMGGIKTTRIDLVPKSKEEKNFFNTVQLWVPEDKGNPIQEKFLTGKESKDYNAFLFSNLKINPPLPDSDFELNLPAGVKVNKP
jgi:outer membrane lipoprotein-sorting protein